MATINTIKIKRSSSAAAPSSTLSAGELAYSENSSKLYYGNIAQNANLILGGKLYTDMLDQTAGTLTASSAVLVDSSSKIDNLLVDNLQLNGNTIQTTDTNGDLTINTNGSGDILFTAATMSTAAQATEFLILDNSATSLVFKQAGNAYVSFDSTNGAERVLFSKEAEFDGVVDIDGSLDLDGVSDFGGYATTNINIDSGAIDGTPIGANSASTGAFSTLAASGAATLSGNTTVGGTLGVTGVATFTTHAVFGDSDIIKLGTGADLTLYHDGTNSYITNAVGALKIATETSGIAVTIGHTTSETTVADNLTTTGNTSVGGTLGVTGVTTLSGNATVGGTLGVTGVATFTTHAAFGDSDEVKLGAGTDMRLYHDGTNSYIRNKTGALKIATETSGIAVTIGHGTSEVTVGDNLTVTGNLTVSGTTTTVNSTTVSIADPVFEMGASGSDDNLDRGLKMKYNSSGAKLAFMGYDDSDGKFAFIPDATDSSSVFSGTQGTLKANIDAGNTGVKVGDSIPFSDSSGTLTMQNIDALDATTEATIEAAIDTLANLTSVGTLGTGTWQATTVAVGYGGTGLTSPSDEGKVLTSNGSGAWVAQQIDGGTFS